MIIEFNGKLYSPIGVESPSCVGCCFASDVGRPFWDCDVFNYSREFKCSDQFNGFPFTIIKEVYNDN